MSFTTLKNLSDDSYNKPDVGKVVLCLTKSSTLITAVLVEEKPYSYYWEVTNITQTEQLELRTSSNRLELDAVVVWQYVRVPETKSASLPKKQVLHWKKVSDGKFPKYDEKVLCLHVNDVIIECELVRASKDKEDANEWMCVDDGGTLDLDDIVVWSYISDVKECQYQLMSKPETKITETNLVNMLGVELANKSMVISDEVSNYASVYVHDAMYKTIEQTNNGTTKEERVVSLGRLIQMLILGQYTMSFSGKKDESGLKIVEIDPIHNCPF